MGGTEETGGMRITLIGIGLATALLFSCTPADPPKSSVWEFESSIRALEVTEEHGVWWAGAKGLVGHSMDDGASWQVDTLRLSDGTLPAFRSIAVTNEAVFALTIASPAVLFRRDLDAAVWDSVYVNKDPAIFFDSMAFWDDQEGLAMGDATAECLSVLITRDGGRQWNLLGCSELPRVDTSASGKRKRLLRPPMAIWSSRMMRFGWLRVGFRPAYTILRLVGRIGQSPTRPSFKEAP